MTTTGDLYGTGYNDKGQQGSGNTTTVYSFTKRASGVASVVCNDNETWYVTTTGDLYGTGYNDKGQQGSGNTTTVTDFVKRASNVASVFISDNDTWYVTTTGDLYGTGYNSSGQQGSGDTTSVYSFTKRASGVATVATSNSTTWYASLPTYTATIEPNNNSYGSVSSGSVAGIEPGTAVTISNNTLTIGETTVTATPTTATDQYTYGFTNWTVSGDPITTGYTINANVTIVANFTQTTNVYDVSVSGGTGGLVNGEASLTLDDVPYGTSVTLSSNTLTFGTSTPTTVTATASNTAQYTYTFSKWQKNGTDLNADTTTGTDDTFSAVFTSTLNQYTITWSIDGVTSTEQYYYGATPTHADPEKEGYIFTGWDPAIATVTQDATYTAVFSEIVPVTVTLNPGLGTVTPTSITVDAGDPIGELPEASRTDHTFVGWFTQPSGGTEVTSATIVIQDMTIYAQYEVSGALKPLKQLTDIVPLLIAVGLILMIIGSAFYYRYK